MGCWADIRIKSDYLVVDNRAAAANPFWMMVPEVAYWPVLIMATIATVIASQAVITGAFTAWLGA